MNWFRKNSMSLRQSASVLAPQTPKQPLSPRLPQNTLTHEPSPAPQVLVLDDTTNQAPIPASAYHDEHVPNYEDTDTHMPYHAPHIPVEAYRAKQPLESEDRVYFDEPLYKVHSSQLFVQVGIIWAATFQNPHDCLQWMGACTCSPIWNKYSGLVQPDSSPTGERALTTNPKCKGCRVILFNTSNWSQLAKTLNQPSIKVRTTVSL